MRIQSTIIAILLALLSCTVAVRAAEAPEILRFLDLSTADAPLVEPLVHGRPGQNLRILRWFVARGRGGTALYASCTWVRDKGVNPNHTPRLLRLDFATGKVTEHWQNGRRIAAPGRTAATGELLGGDGDDGLGLDAAGMAGGMPEELFTGWTSAPAVCMAPGPLNSVYIATGNGELVQYFPDHDGCHATKVRLRSAPLAMASSAGETLYILYADGRLDMLDALGTGGRGVWRNMPEGITGLAVEADDRLVALAKDASVYTLNCSGRDSISAQPVSVPQKLADCRLYNHTAAPWFEGTAEDGRVLRFAVAGNRARPLETPPGEDFRFYADRCPPTVEIKDASGVRSLGIVLSKAPWDTIRCMTMGPEGRKLYGAGRPMAWIWEFDPATGVMKRHERHYNFYQMKPFGRYIYMCGYFGVKLMKWDPKAPWTFDYSKHYHSKEPWPGHHSPWGPKDSNPRLIAKFRYFRRLNVRRPSGLAIGPDGRVYLGAHNPSYPNSAHFFGDRGNMLKNILGVRFGGALNWYDPATETIGSERAPFVGHEVNDICLADNRYIACVAEYTGSAFEPMPAEVLRGDQFSLFDTSTHTFVLNRIIFNSGVGYVEEGEPGRLVLYGGAPKRYRDEGARSALALFNVHTMTLKKLVLLPTAYNYTSYGSPVRFERGPDNRIYFYAKDDRGIALFRVDSVSGTVEPVLRAKEITRPVDVSMGATFVFGPRRVYFGGARALMSLPLEEVIGDR